MGNGRKGWTETRERWKEKRGREGRKRKGEEERNHGKPSKTAILTKFSSLGALEPTPSQIWAKFRT